MNEKKLNSKQLIIINTIVMFQNRALQGVPK